MLSLYGLLIASSLALAHTHHHTQKTLPQTPLSRGNVLEVSTPASGASSPRIFASNATDSPFKLDQFDSATLFFLAMNLPGLHAPPLEPLSHSLSSHHVIQHAHCAGTSAVSPLFTCTSPAPQVSAALLGPAIHHQSPLFGSLPMADQGPGRAYDGSDLGDTSSANMDAPLSHEVRDRDSAGGGPKTNISTSSATEWPALNVSVAQPAHTVAGSAGPATDAASKEARDDTERDQGSLKTETVRLGHRSSKSSTGENLAGAGTAASSVSLIIALTALICTF
ncbi:hypothetical protein CFIMG_000300RA [Ceratocystis fimbriata CBS 114723]|uniref:Uncharacterized protein n=1 Tax=Ceratocystis fimbriata CBS 114723 TaxID=1035309 RepID=A0A2C5XI08_9PEZI|nr:hypothetical protein CFIMG_000300RA [Ceratocystis fimbriata CBS 114723]